MPRYSIWIQKEDNAKWLAIKDRPKFLHDAIERHSRPVRVIPLANPDSSWVREQGEVLSNFRDNNGAVVKG